MIAVARCNFELKLIKKVLGIQNTKKMKRERLVKVEKSKRELKGYLLVLLGALVLSLGYSLFIIPHNIVPGGVFGMSIVMNEWFTLSVGAFALAMNIPILLWGTKMLGKKAGFKTLLFMVSTSFLVDLLSLLTANRVIINDILVSAIFGGLLIGLAVYIAKKSGATTGGTDVVARILMLKVNMGFSQLILIMNIVVILLGVITFGDFTMAAYCLITIVATTQTIGYLIKKSEQNKTVIIFSKRNDQIQEELARDGRMKREVVKVIHKDSDEKMILVTKGIKKLSIVEKSIYKADPKAQIVALESHINLG